MLDFLIPRSRSGLWTVAAALCFLLACQAQPQAPLIVPVMRKEPPARRQQEPATAPDSGKLTGSRSSGQAAAPSTAVRKTASRQHNKQSAVISDAGLEKAIRQRFAGSKIASDEFEVRVEGGTAFISGRTGVIQHKGTATRMAKTAGADRVVNQVEIDPEARKAAAERLKKARK
jgi:hypothetical protein